MVDSADHDRLDEVKDELHLILQEDLLRDIPLLILANKQDTPNAMSANSLVKKLSLLDIRQRQWRK